MAQFKTADFGQAIRVFTFSEGPAASNRWAYALFSALTWAVSWGFAVLHVLYYLGLQRSLQEESLVIIKDVGIQLTKVRKDGSTSHQFYELSVLRNVVINEVRLTQAMTPYDVYFYLAFIVTGQDQVIVPFQHFKLSLPQVKEVYYSAQDLLFK